jgi:hypothetical protein
MLSDDCVCFSDCSIHSYSNSMTDIEDDSDSLAVYSNWSTLCMRLV